MSAHDSTDKTEGADSSSFDAEAYLANSVLVVGDAGMASATSLASLGYDVRLAQIGADETLEIVWRSDKSGVTIELDDHQVGHVDLVYVAEPVDKFVRVVKVARQIGAAIVWSPFADHDNIHRKVAEGAGLFFVAGVDIVVVARRHLRNAGLIRLEIIDAQLLAQEKWVEISEIVAESDDREIARSQLQNALDLSDLGVNFVLDMMLGQRSKLAMRELRDERAALVASLGGHV